MLRRGWRQRCSTARTSPRSSSTCMWASSCPRPRLLERHDDHLRFTMDARVPFANNAAEREIRMIKIRQKVSGFLRTLAGAEQFCLIRSYLATTAKHGTGLMNALTQLAHGHPWLPATI